MPEAELRNTRRNAKAWSAVLAGVSKPDYSRIHVPALAIYAAPRSLTDVPPWLKTDDPQQQALLQESFEYGRARRERAIQAFRRSRQPRVVLLAGADHYVFLSNEAEVLQEVRAFLAALHEGNNAPHGSQGPRELKMANGMCGHDGFP